MDFVNTSNITDSTDITNKTNTTNTANYTISKGCVDYWAQSYEQINNLKKKVENIFIANGGIPLETPVFENKSVLMGKYGDEADTKLVYNINEEGGEPVTLRYDHTVPFIRFIKSNGIVKTRRYTIGKVYRRDQPQLSKGRLREFYQADFDILGESNETALAEFTLLSMVSEFMSLIAQPDFTIYINHTENLKWILCGELGLDPINFKRVCGLIDKIDFVSQDVFTSSWAQITGELSKYFTPEQIVKLQQLVLAPTPANNQVNQSFSSLVDFANIFGFGDKIKFSTCLARGLDYYNGFIFEVKLNGSTCSNTIIAGGRYDSMVDDNTLVGISFGLSRIAQLIPQENPNQNQWKPVGFVTTLGKIPIETKLQVIRKLKSNSQFTAILYNFDKKDKKLTPTITNCVQNYWKYLIVLAETELADGKIILKDLENKTQTLIDL